MQPRRSANTTHQPANSRKPKNRGKAPSGKQAIARAGTIPTVVLHPAACTLPQPQCSGTGAPRWRRCLSPLSRSSEASLEGQGSVTPSQRRRLRDVIRSVAARARKRLIHDAAAARRLGWATKPSISPTFGPTCVTTVLTTRGLRGSSSDVVTYTRAQSHLRQGR